MRRTRWLLATAVLACVPGSALAASGTDRCRSILPMPNETGGMRPLAPEDLARLRDIGPIDPVPFAAPFFTLSPDGRHAAFQLRQGDPGTNRVCLAMVVVDLAGSAPPRIVDDGGELLLLNIDLRGIAEFPTGITRLITPRWSPDGRWIAFLKRERGTTQVWQAWADGRGSVPLTRSDLDVVDFRISADGDSLLYVTKPELKRARDELAQEQLTGWHFDDRFAPFASHDPFPLAPVHRVVRVQDLRTGAVRAPTTLEQAGLDGDGELITAGGRPPSDQFEPGLSVSQTNLSGGAKAGALHARLASGSIASCAKAECEGAAKPWWMPGHRTVRFLRREGWANASTAIYEWNILSGAVRRLYLTDDLLADCAALGARLLCLRDSSLAPRRLEWLDPESGRRQLLFDPNPEFAHLELGQVRRLHWRNRFGIETMADLIYPVGYKRGRRYPLVVVQYDTRGFLRGGTGDEYPIQAFANRGFAVLSFRRPEAMGDVKGAKDFKEGRRLNLAQFADRRSVQSSIEGGIRLVIADGVADPERLGITGLSDGASTVSWALIHSSLFKAAAMSSCCMDTDLAMQVGPAAARDFIGVGYPGMLERTSPFWKDLSFSVNARTIKTPTLLQQSDDEYLDSQESFTTLREAGAPFDLFMFPDEHHVKWQPAHRLAIYRRSLDWFDYWLNNIRSSDPARQSELKHWDELRKQNDEARRS